MIDRHQTGNDMREKGCKGTLTLCTGTLDPTEQTARCCHRGNKHGPPHKRLTMLPGTSKCIHCIQGSFTLPCIPVVFLSSLQIVDRGFVQIEVQIQKPTSRRKSPSFPLHHSRIGPTTSQTHRDYFLIHKNPEPFNRRHASISRYCFMYTTV